jgi:hypothetical protein
VLAQSRNVPFEGTENGRTTNNEQTRTQSIVSDATDPKQTVSAERSKPDAGFSARKDSGPLAWESPQAREPELDEQKIMRCKKVDIQLWRLAHPNCGLDSNFTASKLYIHRR